MAGRTPWADRGSRHARGYDSRWVRLRSIILTRDDHLCQPCHRKGRVTVATQVDHIIPKARGGTDDPDNLEAICAPCHDAKSAREAAEAQGRKHRERPEFTSGGTPVWPDEYPKPKA